MDKQLPTTGTGLYHQTPSPVHATRQTNLSRSISCGIVMPIYLSRGQTCTADSSNDMHRNPGFYHKRCGSAQGCQREINIPLNSVHLRTLRDPRMDRPLDRVRCCRVQDLKLPTFHPYLRGDEISLSRPVCKLCPLQQSQCQDSQSNALLQYYTAQHHCMPVWKRPCDIPRHDHCSMPKRMCTEYESKPYGTCPPCHRMTVNSWELNSPLTQLQCDRRNSSSNFKFTQREHCPRQNFPVRYNNHFRGTQSYMNCFNNHQTREEIEYHSHLEDNSRLNCVKPWVSIKACRPCSGQHGAPIRATGLPILEKHHNPHADFRLSRDATWDQTNSFRHNDDNSFSSFCPSGAGEQQRRNDFGSFVNKAHRRVRRRYRRTLNARQRLTFETEEPLYLDAKAKEQNSETQFSGFWSHGEQCDDDYVTEKKMVHAGNPREFLSSLTVKSQPNKSNKIQLALPSVITAKARSKFTGTVFEKDNSVSESMETTHKEATSKRKLYQASENSSLSVFIQNQQKEVCKSLVAEKLIKNVDLNAFSSDSIKEFLPNTTDQSVSKEGNSASFHSESTSSTDPESLHVTGDFPVPSSVAFQRAPLLASKQINLAGVHSYSQMSDVKSTSVNLSNMPTKDRTVPCVPVGLKAGIQNTGLLARRRSLECFLSSYETIKSLNLIGKFHFMGSVSLKQTIMKPTRPCLMHSLTPVKMRRITSYRHKMWQAAERRDIPGDLKNVKVGEMNQCHGGTRKCAEAIGTGAVQVQVKHVHQNKLKVDTNIWPNIKKSITKLWRNKCVKTTPDPTNKVASTKSQEKMTMDTLYNCTIGQSDTSSCKNTINSKRKSFPAVTLSDKNDLHVEQILEKEREACAYEVKETCQGIGKQSDFSPAICQGNLSAVKSSEIQVEPKEHLVTLISSSCPLKLPTSTDSDSVHKRNTCCTLTHATVITVSKSQGERDHYAILSPNQSTLIDVPVERPHPVTTSVPELHVLSHTASAEQLNVTISPLKLDAVADDVKESISSEDFTTPSPNCASQFVSVFKETPHYANIYPEDALNILVGIPDMEQAKIETGKTSLRPVSDRATDRFTSIKSPKLNLCTSTCNPSNETSLNTNPRSIVDKTELECGQLKIAEKRTIVSDPELNSHSVQTGNQNTGLIQQDKEIILNQKATVSLKNVHSDDLCTAKSRATTKSIQPQDIQYSELMAGRKYFLQLQDRKSSRSLKDREAIISGNTEETASLRKSTSRTRFKEHGGMSFDQVSASERKANKISLSCKALIKVTRIDMGDKRSLIVEDKKTCNVMDTTTASKELSKLETKLFKRKEDKEATFSPQHGASPADELNSKKDICLSKNALASIMRSPEFKSCRPLRISLSRIQLDMNHGQTKKKRRKKHGFEVSQKDSQNAASAQWTTSADRISGKRRLNLKDSVGGEPCINHDSMGKPDACTRRPKLGYDRNMANSESCDAERKKGRHQISIDKRNVDPCDGSVSEANCSGHLRLNTNTNASVDKDPLVKECHQPIMQKVFTTANKNVHGQSFVKAGSKQFPVRIISQPLISCKFCNNYSARWQRKVSSHVREAHPFRCYKCFQTFQTKDERLCHNRGHLTKLHHCSLCNRAFTKYHNYTRHIKGQPHQQFLQIQQNTFKLIRRALRKQTRVLKDAERCSNMLALDNEPFNETKTLPGKDDPKQDSAIEHVYHENKEFRCEMAKFEEKELSKMITVAVAQMCGSGTQTQLALHKDMDAEGYIQCVAPALALPTPATSHTVSHSAPSQCAETVYSVSNTPPSRCNDTISHPAPSRHVEVSYASSASPYVVSQAEHSYSSAFTLSQDDDAFLTSLLDVGDLNKTQDPTASNPAPGTDRLLPHSGWMTHSMIQRADDFISELGDDSPGWTLPRTNLEDPSQTTTTTTTPKSRQDIDLTSLMGDLPDIEDTDNVPEATIVDSDSLKNADLSIGENLLLLL